MEGAEPTGVCLNDGKKQAEQVISWEQRKFSEIAQRESAAKKSSTDFPSVEYEDVVSEVGILNKDVRLKEAQKTGIGFDGSQVLYGKLRPYLHNWLSPDFSGVAVGDWWVLKPVNVDKSFLFRLIQTEKFDDIANQSSGSKMPRADWNLLSNTEFMVPAEIEEERKIGQYFSELDNLITLHQRKLEKLKIVKKAMLENCFPKNGEKSPRIRFGGFTDDWEQRKLGDIVEFLDTLRKPLTENTRTKGPYPYYGASGVVDHVADYLFNEELILLSEDGANITDRNYPVCFLASGKYWVNNHAHVLRAKPKMDNNFICMSLERKDYSNYNTGMAMPKLNQDTCRRIPVDCPSYEEQKKIGDYFRSLDNLITLHQCKLNLTNNYRNRSNLYGPF
ncbi:MAG: restriction endonuclease subunit S [Lachnospiraceae bacterium]|jgi:type I restriction enzyme S subunit|nr:restriction endonuclease subunit S [Lachnospiraceae bacterium]MCI1655978.1 restriction endonuclease subunit S [Lachnospiraceae bacterium]MCI2194460.1 restriction endonuclease subunit S [Lachnospiraceae bacterium]